MPDNSSTPTLIPEPVQSEAWSLPMAGKKLAWALTSWKASVPAGVAMAPAATAIIDSISAATAGFGITLHIDKPVFESMLPVIIFAGMIMAHDFAKLKLAENPIAKKLL